MSAVQLRRVPTGDLTANRRNVRESLDGVEELAASIRANGLLQPLIVNDQAGRLVVTDGHRRLEAARLAGVPAVMCLVTTGATARQVTTTMLAAAMHKELKPLEQARAFKALQSEGVTVADIARSTGYSQALVRGRLLLLDLPLEAQDMVDNDELTIGQAADLAKQLRASKRGHVASGARTGRNYWRDHSLRETARAHCTHQDTRVTLGHGAACPPCFEQVIRADERARIEAAS
ncbi:MAG: ParB/RepB/Spo0J family partition protein [Dermatophilaceae bacterium]|nr:ParB/RepB/Spo0J family partition protein [Dermatophilaceae bacterium]